MAAGLVVATVIVAVAAAAAGWSAREAAAVAARLDDLPLALGAWTGNPEPVPPAATEMLAYDEAVHRTYRNNLGHAADVWVMYWTSASAMKGYHGPEVCAPAQGFTEVSRWDEPVRLPNGPPVRAAGWEFTRPRDGGGRDRWYLVRWVQDGREYRAPGDDLALSGRGWVQDLLVSSERGTPPRLTVQIWVPGGKAVARREAISLAEPLASALYELCPWADPHHQD